MDKNTLTGLVLIALIILGYNYYANTSQQELMEQAKVEAVAEGQKKTDAPQSTHELTAAAQLEQLRLKVDSSDLFRKHLVAADSVVAPIVLKNSKVQLEVSPRGAYVSRVELPHFLSYKNYHEGKEEALLLFDHSTSGMDMIFETTEGIHHASRYVFDVVEHSDSSVVLALTSVSGDVLSVRYDLLPDHYMVNTTISSEGRHFKGDHLGLHWNDKVRRIEKGFYFENMYSTLTYRDNDGDTEKLDEYNNDKETSENPVRWIAFKNQYFSAVLIAGNAEFENVKLASDTCAESTGFIKSYSADMQVPYQLGSGKDLTLQYYFGPNKYRYLQSMEDCRLADHDLRLETLVYLGWPVFKWINRFFTIYVFDFLTGFGMNMGIVLLLITLLLRFIVYPAARKSYISTAKMKVLKPKIDEITKKYSGKDEALKRQQETMMLYNRYGVSPMGGCLPMLIQMPIWIAMFNFIPNAFELRQQSFLWADDLSTYDSLLQFDHHYWLIGDHLSLFCILFCGTNLLYSWIMMQQQKSSMSAEQQEQMKVMRWMTFLMPLFFFFMFNKYSAGLNYYYFISLLAGALTMWYLRRTTNEEKLLARLEDNYRKNKDNPKKQSGFAARLQAYQKMQEEELKRRRGQK